MNFIGFLVIFVCITLLSCELIAMWDGWFETESLEEYVYQEFDK